MAQRIKASINPDILVWARQTAGYSQEEAAKKIGISQLTLHKWESGQDFPTLKQLRNSGNVYKRPTALFYRTIAPTDVPKLPDFRLVYDKDSHEYTPQLRLEIRRAFDRRATAISVSTLLNETPNEFKLSATINDTPESVAKLIRAAINVSIEKQYSWKDHYEALRTWVASIEALGVLVFHINHVEVEQSRGFSIGEHPYPVVAINGKDSPRGRIFTLFHELTHIILHNSGVCNLRDNYENPHHNVEYFCNQVAGEFLVPNTELLQQDVVIENKGNWEWDEWRLSTLANRFMVSQEVILRRLLSLKRTTEQFYNQKREEYLEVYRRQGEENSGGFIPYHRRVLRTNGRAYTNLVLNAYYNDSITSRDLSNFLGGIKLDHIVKIEQEIGRGGIDA
ncbi:XRE family transcriptional regulator [uncultured Paenibacillus sp.]|uniref:XRE family transcriptional regulator n=1 Tax=uncultured Paenibacillus sp. TaxID=227322 RepID=UPI0028D8F690|nr:XRE family transcriptional regulator [uncultured Paenibacillus sp.]